MSRVRFEPMSEQDYLAYLRKSVPEYAHDQVQSGNWHPAEAVARATHEFNTILPNGPRTPGNFLYTILDEQGRKIGMLWYTLDEKRPRPQVFLADFFIFSEFRNRGYEDETLDALEAEWRAKGVGRVELQVFAHNAAEVELYRRHGYEVASLYLGKMLPPAE